MMGYWVGTIYASGTITANQNSGWLTVPLPYISRAYLRLVPADLATDETLDLDLNVAWDTSGTGDHKLHDFTQVDSNNTAESLVLPGGESADLLSVTDGNAPIPPYWKFSSTLGGTTKSMQYTVYLVAMC